MFQFCNIRKCSKPKCSPPKCTTPKCYCKCDSGYKNVACACTKIDVKKRPRYTRKAAKWWVCPQNRKNEAGLCYVPCKSGYTGIGTLCTS